MVKKVVVDCDNTMGKPFSEIDDGLTILYLLGCEDIELVGITNCYANSSIRDVEYWTDRFLHDINRTDIPRHSGKPFSGQNPTDWFKNAWGHHFLNEREDTPGPSDAATFLVEQANRYPGQLYLLAVGSMTNLFEAWSIDHAFFKKIKLVALMGGVLGDLELRGKPCRELNLSSNPAGAFRVLHNGECPVVVMNANICIQAPFTEMNMPDVAFWPARRKRMLREWLGVSQGTFYLWDLLPAVYLSHPDLFDLKRVSSASTSGDLEQGILVTQGEGPQVIMPETILDRVRFMNIINKAWRKEWEQEDRGWQ
jgi:purine nucleosidase